MIVIDCYFRFFLPNVEYYVELLRGEEEPGLAPRDPRASWRAGCAAGRSGTPRAGSRSGQHQGGKLDGWLAYESARPPSAACCPPRGALFLRQCYFI